MNNFSEKVKEARIAKKLTQKELAEKIGVSDARIRQYESNKGFPSAEVLFKICLELDVSADWLLGLPAKSNTTNEAM